jgi:hypothetical protein
MQKRTLSILGLFLLTAGAAVSATSAACAQDIHADRVPAAVKTAFSGKYAPGAAKVSWEIEKGNYEANWGGKSGEDNSAQFTPAGVFVEYAQAIPMSQLPASVAPYVREHYKTRPREAAAVTDAAGAQSYEVEIKGKDLVFAKDGTFVKEEKGD